LGLDRRRFRPNIVIGGVDGLEEAADLAAGCDPAMSSSTLPNSVPAA
jgi:hypothetical protein